MSASYDALSFPCSPLATLAFVGSSEYLDQLFTHIEGPLLKYIGLGFFDLAVFDISQTSPFITPVHHSQGIVWSVRSGTDALYPWPLPRSHEKGPPVGQRSC